MAREQDYREWLADVDVELVTLCGCDSEELPDYDYPAEFDAGSSPRRAAIEALKGAGEAMLFDVTALIRPSEL